MNVTAETLRTSNTPPGSVHARLPGVDGSPWQALLDSYYRGTDVERRGRGGSWARGDSYWSGAWIGDDAADTLAQAIIERDVSRATFEAALESADLADAPDPVRAFLHEARSFPAELDMEAVARGAQTFRQMPPVVSTPHGIVAGFVLAAITPNAAIPLSLNENVVKATQRRYMRTLAYVANILSPGGIRPAGVGFKSACRVRLVHGFVRSEIKRHFDWKWDRYGAPIHVVALMTAAAVTGTWTLSYLERLGCAFTEQEKEDVAMFNAWQAHVNGVPAEYNLYTHRDWEDFIYWAVYFGGLPDAEDMQRAKKVLGPLLGNGYPLSPNAQVNDAFNAMMLAATRDMMGQGICDLMEIDRARVAEVIQKPSMLLARAASRVHRRRGKGGLYDRACEAWWSDYVPNMVERITGQRTTRYDASAKVTR